MPKSKQNHNNYFTQTQQLAKSKVFNPITSKIKPDILRKSQSQVFSIHKTIQKEIQSGQTQIIKNKDLTASNTYPQTNRQQLKKIKHQKDQLMIKINQMSHSIHQLQIQQKLRLKLIYSSSKSQHKSTNLTFSMSESRIMQRRWKKQMRERSKRIQQKRRIVQQRYQQKIQQQQQQKQKNKQSQAQIKRQQLKQKLKKINQRTLMRNKQNEISNQKIKNLCKNKKMYQKMKQYYKNQQKSILIANKQKLQNIKILHKPIDGQQLKKHEQKFDEVMQNKSQLRLKRSKQILDRARSYQAPYQSIYYKRILKQENDLINSRCSLVQSRYKIKDYAESVRKNIVIKIDQSKKAFLQQIKNKHIDNRSRQQKQRQRNLKIAQKGKQTIEFMRSIPKKPKKQQSFTNTDQKRKYQNYLSYSLSKAKKQQTWQGILKNNKLSKQTKLTHLRAQFQKIEEKQLQKKKIERVFKQKTEQNLDEQYFDMVRAKLQILNSAS